MLLSDAKRLARAVLDQNGLRDWSVKMDGGKRRFGSCVYAIKTITLSRFLVRLNEEREVIQTIKHEVAHALAPMDGHGSIWASKCYNLGIVPARCYDAPHRNVVRVAPNFFHGCGNCGLRIGRFRRTNKRLACAACCQKHNGGRFTDAYLLKEVA